MVGVAENAGVENAAPDCRGGKRGTRRRVENAGVEKYGKPKVPVI